MYQHDNISKEKKNKEDEKNLRRRGGNEHSGPSKKKVGNVETAAHAEVT